MKALLRLCAACLATLTLVLGLGTPVVADPSGDEYQITITNLPIDAGPVILTFDGIEENVGGPGGLLVSEMSTSLPGSELLEWWLRTADGGPLSNDLFSEALVSAADVDWGSGEVCQYDSSSLFIYFTIDGDPQTMSDPNGVGAVFGPHPTNPSIQVWFGPFNPDLVICGTGGLSYSIGPEFGYGTLLPFLGLDPNTINDVHFGFEVVLHAPVPVEPSTWGRIKGLYR